MPSSISESGSTRSPQHKPPIPLRNTLAAGDDTTPGREASSIFSLGGVETVPAALVWAVERQASRMEQSAEGPLPFPLDCFPADMAEFIRQAATSFPCPPDYI